MLQHVFPLLERRNIKQTIIMHAYLNCTWPAEEMSDGGVVNVITFPCTSAKTDEINLKKMLG